MIETPRLILRPWLDRDLDALTAINDDPAVYQWLAGPFTREMNAASIARQHRQGNRVNRRTIPK